MPVRATKRGADRTPLGGDFDVLICGASFAGLAIARELRATGARVLVLDRYEIGERQTSACAAPTELAAQPGAGGLDPADVRLAGLPHAAARARAGRSAGRSPRSTTGSCATCCGRSAARGRSSRPRRSRTVAATRRRHGAHTDRGDVSAPLIVDALGWKRILGAEHVQPPDARLSRGLEVHPGGTRRRPRAVDRQARRPRRATAGRSRRATSCGSAIGSFDPRDHVKDPTVRARRRARAAARRLSGQLDPAPAPPRDRGRRSSSSATRPATACRSPRRASAPRSTSASPAGASCARCSRAAARASRRSRATAPSPPSHGWKYACMLQVQHAIPKLRPRALGAMARTFERGGPAHWAFRHYLRIAPPEFALPAPPAARCGGATPGAARPRSALSRAPRRPPA